jgi:hypothetical protein
MIKRANLKQYVATCNDCYFNQAGLCALAGDTPCPTFRAAQPGELLPPRQAPLIARPLARTTAAA